MWDSVAFSAASAAQVAVELKVVALAAGENGLPEHLSALNHPMLEENF